MAISRWSPVTDLVSLHSAMDRLSTDSLTSGGRRRGDIFGVSGEGFLPLDIYQNDKEWVIRAAVPSVNPEQVEVTCDGSTIRISGEIKPPENTKSENYVMRENYYGAFSREVTLPEETMCDQSRGRVPQRDAHPDASEGRAKQASGKEDSGDRRREQHARRIHEKRAVNGTAARASTRGPQVTPVSVDSGKPPTRAVFPDYVFAVALGKCSSTQVRSAGAGSAPVTRATGFP